MNLRCVQCDGRNENPRTRARDVGDGVVRARTDLPLTMCPNERSNFALLPTRPSHSLGVSRQSARPFGQPLCAPPRSLTLLSWETFIRPSEVGLRLSSPTSVVVEMQNRAIPYVHELVSKVFSDCQLVHCGQCHLSRSIRPVRRRE